MREERKGDMVELYDDAGEMVGFYVAPDALVEAIREGRRKRKWRGRIRSFIIALAIVALVAIGFFLAR